MGIPNLCQVELELSTLPRPRYKELIKENRKQLLPARILPFRFCTIQTVEQPLILSFHRRKHQHHERRSKQLCTTHALFMANGIRRQIREWLVNNLRIRISNHYQWRCKERRQCRQLTPYVSAAFKPFHNEGFRVRFFYKDIFRLASFNDLYYEEVGNTQLKPEKAKQYNIGLTYNKNVCSFLPYLSATIDAYYNKVTDKIIAYPTKNLAVWSMKNLGQVDIKGIDVTGSLSLQPGEKIRINLSGNYTYQRALDVTPPDPNTYESTYKHQIAYTPRVSASGQAGIETPWINLSYSFLFSGKRYALGQNIAENRLDSYSDTVFLQAVISW